jgi:hypothetical protein
MRRLKPVYIKRYIIGKRMPSYDSSVSQYTSTAMPRKICTRGNVPPVDMSVDRPDPDVILSFKVY